MPSPRATLWVLFAAASSGCATSRPAVEASPPPPIAAARTARSVSLKSASARQGPWYGACEQPGQACRKAAPTALTCPAAQDAVTPGDVCGLAGVTPPKVCEFETGRCRCVHHVYCGGPVPTYLQQQAMTWECAPTRKEGDCPDEPPVAGAACTPTREACATSGCGNSQVCRCDSGRWACETHAWAPPE